ncbi:MAG TPA: hypothetical protein VE690_14890, partial [Rhodopila sp.]|nr:hypothetical protein [Rhodopila sp.]
MRSALWGTTVGLAAVAAVAIGIDASQSPAPGGTRQAEPPAYRPVTSDLMNDVIQPRHVKLWLAGKSQNWAFAEYERHNIGGALARMTQAIPTYKNMSTASLVGSFATPELADLETAIKARNEMAFVQA